MPVNVNIDPDTGIAHYSASGDMTREDVISVVGQVYRDPAFRAPWHSIWDLTGANPLFTSDELRQVVAYVQDHRPEDAGKIAIVATEDLAFGVSRMYEIFSSDLNVEIQVFRDLEPARQWLLGGEAEPA